MGYFKVKVDHLIVESAGPQKTFVRTFATKPISSISGKAGKIFGIIEIGSTDPTVNDLIDLIIDQIKNNYYYDEEKNSELATTAERFETALKKTNLAIASFVESEQIKLDLSKVNILLAIQKNQELHFTLTGSIGVYLFYSIAKANYKIINILDASNTGQSDPEPLKFFSQVISGKIRLKDILFLTTINVLYYFSLETIKNAVTSEEGITKLQNLILNTQSKENFGGLAVSLEKTEEKIVRPTDINQINYREAASQDSIRDLIRTEKETAKLLTPSIMPELKKYAKAFQDSLQNYLSKAKSSSNTLYQKQKTFRPNIPSLGAKNNVQKKNQSALVNKNLFKAKTGFKKIFFILLAGLRSIKDFIIRQAIWKKISSLLGQILATLYARFNRLPSSSKLLLIASVILIIIFTGSITWNNVQKQKQQRISDFNNTIFQATSMKDEAQSSLIYRDEIQARSLLSEALGLLDSLESKTDEETNSINSLKQEIENELQNLRHIVNIDEPVQIVNFQNLDPQASIAPFAVLNNTTLYTQNQNNQSIYKADLQSRVMSSIFSPAVTTGNLKTAIVISPAEIVLFSQTNAAFRLNPTTDVLQNLNLNINDNADVTDITSYLGRLYILDKKNSKIYRYSPVTNGYGNATDWINEAGLNLSNAAAFTIDGSIYILLSTGQIIKMQNGLTVDFQAGSIDPPLQNPTKIKTPENSNFLYILDQPSKRIIVIDKDGNLVNQYTSEKFIELKDFVINEATKELYVLSGTTVYGVPLEHL